MADKKLYFAPIESPIRCGFNPAICVLREKLGNRDVECASQLYESSDAKILLSPFNGSGKRSSQTALMRELLLGPFALYSQGSYPPAQLFPHRSGILHALYNRRIIKSYQRSIVGRSIIGICCENRNTVVHNAYPFDGSHADLVVSGNFEEEYFQMSLRGKTKESGQAILETAVILPVLVFVALGLIDIQWTLERLANLNYIVTETARCEAIGAAPCTTPNTPPTYANRLAEDLRMDPANLTWSPSSGCNEVNGICTVTIAYRYKPLEVWFPTVTLRRTGSAALPHPSMNPNGQ